MLFAIDMGYSKVVIESDNLCAIQRLSMSCVDLSYFGLIIGDCLQFWSSCESTSFVHFRPDGNRVVHSLANIAQSLFFLKPNYALLNGTEMHKFKIKYGTQLLKGLNFNYQTRISLTK